MEELDIINQLIDALTYLPTIGQKSAERIAYAILNNKIAIEKIINSFQNLKDKIQLCPICGFYVKKGGQCKICQNPDRDHSVLMILYSFKDLCSFEKTKKYNGLYHVLNKTTDQIKTDIEEKEINHLLKRIEEEKEIKEIILATDPTIEGNIIALHIVQLLKNKNSNITFTRLAYGLPIGSRIEYADTLTIEKSLEERKKI